MSTRTPRLSLTTNSTTDPFSLTDFNNNWNAVDSAPGVFVCTSTSRPTWGTAQTGRTILETNTKRTLVWTGTSFAEPAVAAGVWTFAVNPQQTLGQNANVVYTMGTITVTRPCLLAIVGSMTSEMQPFVTQYMTAMPMVDNVERPNGANTNGGFVRWADISTSATAPYDTRGTPFFGQVVLSVGNHTIQVRVKTGPLGGAGAPVIMNSIDLFGFVAAGYGGASTY